MTFSDKSVMQTFVSPNSKNAWALIDTLGWKKVRPLTKNGVTNVFIILSLAKAHGRTVSGTLDNITGEISLLYLN